MREEVLLDPEYWSKTKTFDPAELPTSLQLQKEEIGSETPATAMLSWQNDWVEHASKPAPQGEPESSPWRDVMVKHSQLGCDSLKGVWRGMNEKGDFIVKKKVRFYLLKLRANNKG